MVQVSVAVAHCLTHPMLVVTKEFFCMADNFLPSAALKFALTVKSL